MTRTDLGDLGMLARGDVVVALSASGETEEILQLLATIKRLQLPLIAVTCDDQDRSRGPGNAGPRRCRRGSLRQWRNRRNSAATSHHQTAPTSANRGHMR